MPTPSAEWRSIPRRGRLAEVLWSLRKVAAWQWSLTLIVFVLAIASQLEKLSRGRTSIPFIVAWIPIWGTIAYSMLIMFTIERPGRWLTARLRMRTAKDTYPVMATVVRNFVPIGQSEGLVTIDGGVLRFEGEMTNFVLGRSDVLAPREAYENWSETEDDEKRRSFGNCEGGSAWGFALAEDDNVWVTFFPLKARGSSSIWRPLYAWLQTEPVPFDGTILPPLEPQPGYRPPDLLVGKGKTAPSRLSN